MPHTYWIVDQTLRQAIVSTQRDVTWRDILRLMGKHTLQLRRDIYTVVQGPRRVSIPDASSEVVDVTCGANGPHAYISLGETAGITIEAPAADSPKPTQVQRAVRCPNCRALIHDLQADALGQCREALHRRGVIFTEEANEAPSHGPLRDRCDICRSSRRA